MAKKNLKNYPYLVILFVIIFTLFSCNKISRSFKSDFPETVFLIYAEKTNQSLAAAKQEIFSLENKNLLLLPFYSPLNSFKNVDNHLLNKLFTNTKKMLSTTDLKTSHYIYNNYQSYLPKSSEVTRLDKFQKLLYEISISEKSLSRDIGSFHKADLILTNQIDFWPDFENNSHINKQKMQIQTRLIDVKSGLILWTGINYANLNADDNSEDEFNNLIRVILVKLSAAF
ncbi:MAG: hypothetical protein JJV97_01640 [SAR324 cluster bacterium]|nr:hypothetical protein [SAR324 cluster bacterium]